MTEKFDYNALLFRELRVVALEPTMEASDESIAKAVTLNENLKSLGYCFSPDSFVLLSKSNIDNLFEDIKGYVGEVKAEPMYKGFPQEVMEMDEATFRFHQILHYMSTYGVEFFTGVPVSKGWLPESTDVVRDKEDAFKTDLKVIEVIEDEDKYFVGARRVLMRKVRLTNSQVELVKEAVTHLSTHALEMLEIPFKENVQEIFNLGMAEKSLDLLKVACKNPMDAFKCVSAFLDGNNWHLKTSQKRLVAKLLDTFSDYPFEENLIYSNARREEVIHILDQVDYPTYSRNVSHKASLNALKDKKLKSWMSKVENAITAKDAERLFSTLNERPGMFLRMAIRLIRLGYKKEVEKNLIEIAPKLSAQTIVDIMNAYTFNKGTYIEDNLEDKITEWDSLMKILKKVLTAKLASMETDLKGKKVYLDPQDYDLKHSMIMKSEEGGYNRGGLAFKLPRGLKKVRFFVYWNDENRVDIDLHANCFNKDGSRENVGWNSRYKTENDSVVFSGDITHSDAAEYIDIDLTKSDIRYITANVNIYTGQPDFASIKTCFTGLMGVKNLGQDVKLYDPKACFISHELMSKSDSLEYGLVDLEHKYVRYIGTTVKGGNGDGYFWEPSYGDELMLSLKDYLNLLFKTQEVEVVKNKEDADVVLSMAKGGDISLIDKNFYIDL